MWVYAWVAAFAMLVGCSGDLSADGAMADGGHADLGGPLDGGGLDAAASADLGATEDGSVERDGGPADAGAELDAGPRTERLLERTGCFFTPSTGELFRAYRVGESGTVYRSVTVRFDVLAGPYQPPIPDPSNRTEHILFGFGRANQSSSYQRYLMGAAAVDFVSRAPHFRMFGRDDIAMGFMSYTSDSGTYRWSEGTRYTLECVLDATVPVQRCDLSTGGAVVATRELPVTYLDAATHLSTAFDLELGTDQPIDHDHLQSPRGWTFCELEVTAEAL